MAEAICVTQQSSVMTATMYFTQRKSVVIDTLYFKQRSYVMIASDMMAQGHRHSSGNYLLVGIVCSL
jgi:hypothetical protein